MTAGVTVARPENPGATISTGKQLVFPQLARNLSGHVERAVYDPKGFSAALAAHGISRSPDWVRAACLSRRLATLPTFPGRWVIPASELTRLLSGAEAVA